MFYCSGPQHLWHQGLVSWKTIFPRTKVGEGKTGGGAQAREGGESSGGHAMDGGRGRLGSPVLLDANGGKLN